ncbi:alpha/beta fold hydrolase [Arachidicoccus soli]|uniref:Alpha/beta hydrolase n=1 Tax=Arachidicoccus soli TaxID=2341117 RepID=A0A386HQL6_9BACT|nr:alpha/beta hydrolase [Arachidicoccus soli]AYD48238.1 alpha/beta hydrolase [Arachidicoccus soli]
MKKTIIFFAFTLLTLVSCNHSIQSKEENNQLKRTTKNDSLAFKSGYSEVNGIRMYYEIYGQGKPLVLIHGGGSTIQTTFGRVIPLLAKKYKVIAMDLQAHGRTSDRNAPVSFAQDANDVVTLLENLNIPKADFFGFSNGGTTAMLIAIHHPKMVDKLILGSALCKRGGVPKQFWSFMEHQTLANMPQQLKEAYLEVTRNPKGLQIMHDKDMQRMLNFKDIPDTQIKSIKAPTLIIIGDKDVITPEHAIEMNRLIANSELAIIPPGGHGEYIGEVTTLKPGFKATNLIAIPLIEKFLDQKGK